MFCPYRYTDLRPFVLALCSDNSENKIDVRIIAMEFNISIIILKLQNLL